MNIFDKLRDLKANKQEGNDEKFTLLMYLCTLVNKNYPDLSNWTKMFENCEACIKIKLPDLEKDTKAIDKKVKNLAAQLKRMQKERENFEKEEAEKAKKAASKKKKKKKVKMMKKKMKIKNQKKHGKNHHILHVVMYMIR